eukprot:COSAG01_NODE_1651_length_9623_cov_6.232045_14_plen_90_part_00
MPTFEGEHSASSEGDDVNEPLQMLLGIRERIARCLASGAMIVNSDSQSSCGVCVCRRGRRVAPPSVCVGDDCDERPVCAPRDHATPRDG